jgi:glycosyltransferase involved in cell wall biosynthesis
MKISIITPSYNQGRFIKDTIESVLSQDYPNYEHIIVDGCSTDNTLEIIKSYPRVKWISEKDNGPVDAINKGIKLSTGEICAWLNSDDYYEENIFKTIVDLFESRNDLGVVYGNQTYVNESKMFIGYDKNEYFTPNHLIHVSADGVRQPSVFFRKNLFIKLNGINDKYRCAFDYDLFIRMLQNTNSYHVDSNFSYQRDYESTISRRFIRRQGIEIIKIALKNGASIFDKIIIRSLVKKVLFPKRIKSIK